MRIYSPREWRALRDAHEQAVHERTSAHLERRSRGIKHPVEDFLFTYYPFKPGKLATWHPGAGHGAVIETSADESYFRKRWYTITEQDGQRIAHVDVPAWAGNRGSGATFIRQLLEATLDREASFGCFGLHEWAMVYKQTPDEHRHSQVPLRLSQEETDRVVENHRIQCSHYDAFRFFTPPARPLNTHQPTREGMRQNEQPGCLHAGMDLYKWAMKLEPIVDAQTVLDTFDLALAIRTLDMEASPYDIRAWGYGVVAIETASGKAEYMRRQEDFSRRAQDLRRRLISQIDRAKSLL